jgi:hypothetical protein
MPNVTKQKQATWLLIKLTQKVFSFSFYRNILWVLQGSSTRPERIPASLTALQELNSKILQDLQQQLQDHLAASHKQFRAQVMGIF